MSFFKMSRSRLSFEAQSRDDRDKSRPPPLHICLKLSFDYKVITSRSVMGNRNIAFAKIVLQVLLLFSIVTLFNFKYIIFIFTLMRGRILGNSRWLHRFQTTLFQKYKLTFIGKRSKWNLTDFLWGKFWAKNIFNYQYRT